MPLNWISKQPLHDYSLIVTHGADGEYGHPHHISLHRYVRSLHLPAMFRKMLPPANTTLTLCDEELLHKILAIQCYDVVYEALNDPTKHKFKWQVVLDTYFKTRIDELRTEYYVS
jgi:hypothetical protein